MVFEYSKEQLVAAISDTVTNYFLQMIPAQPDAAGVRAILEEAIEVVVRTTSVIHPDFEGRPAEILKIGRQGSKERADRLLKIILSPGSKAWQAAK